MSINQKAVVARHIPQRSCVACRMVRPKRELMRLVCDSDGTVEVDNTGKKSGRGAYLCPVRECWDTGFKSGRLEHALRTRIGQNDRDRLIQHAGVVMQEKS